LLADEANPEHSRAARLGHAESPVSEIWSPARAKINKSLSNVGVKRARRFHKSARVPRDVQDYDSDFHGLIEYKSLETASAHASIPGRRVIQRFSKTICM
jgi:hypothetical protein